MDTRATDAAAGGPRVVALGDSITLGVGDQPLPGIGAGWAALAAHALGASSFTNLAANGTRAATLALTQVPSALMEMPDIVFMTVGGNDVLRGDFDPGDVTDRVADAVARFERPGRLIVMISLDRIALFDVLGTHVASVMSRRVAQVNAALALATAGTAVRWVDGASVFASAGRRAWHIDRIHPSPLGHRALAAAAIDAIADAAPRVHAMPVCGRTPGIASRGWWLVRQGVPWAAKRSRDLIPDVAQMVAHELLEERRLRHRASAPV